VDYLNLLFYDSNKEHFWEGSLFQELLERFPFYRADLTGMREEEGEGMGRRGGRGWEGEGGRRRS
jgi:hypothetical protein